MKYTGKLKKDLLTYISDQSFMFTLDGHDLRFWDLPIEMQFMTIKKFALTCYYHMIVITTDSEIIADAQSDDVLIHEPCTSINESMKLLINQFQDWYNSKL